MLAKRHGFPQWSNVHFATSQRGFDPQGGALTPRQRP
jgi:hypothetical protein